MKFHHTGYIKVYLISPFEPSYFFPAKNVWTTNPPPPLTPTLPSSLNIHRSLKRKPLALYSRYFRVFFYSKFRLLSLFINFIYAQSVSFTCFRNMSTFTPSFVQLQLRLFCFQLYAVPQFACSDISCSVLLNF